MPVRRLNYTQRKKLNGARVPVAVDIPARGPATFTADPDLDGLKLPGDARVFVEAYRSPLLRRFDFGTVAEPRVPANRSLADFPAPERVLFRVRVVSAGGTGGAADGGKSGLVLAQADRISPKTAEEYEQYRVSLLPVEPDDDLGQQVWALHVDDAEGPVIKLNGRLADHKQAARDPLFMGLVYPAAFRSVLERVLLADRHAADDDADDWRDRWLAFAARLPGVGRAPEPTETAGQDDDAILDWIDRAAAAFAARARLFDHFQTHWKGEETT